MIVSNNSADEKALRILQQLAGKQPNRRLLSLLALDRMAAIQTNIAKLPHSNAIDSMISSYFEEVLRAVDTVLRNDTQNERRRAKRGVDEIHK